MANLPSRRLDIQYPPGAGEDERNETATSQILAFAQDLTSRGERAWFEVWYPAPQHVSRDIWESEQGNSFDAVEVVDGQVVTLPPYAELLAVKS